MMRASEDAYGNLEGKTSGGSRASLRQNVRIYVYPMTATDLREWLKGASSTGWEWSETNGWVSAAQLRHAPPLDTYSLISWPATFLSLCESLCPSCSVHA